MDSTAAGQPNQGSRKKKNEGIDFGRTDEIKQLCVGREIEILTTLGGCDPALLDGKNHPCPKCSGDDRFSYLGHRTGRGNVLCRKCFNEKNGDIIAAIGWLRDWDFLHTFIELAKYVGVFQPQELDATYSYTDENGVELFQVRRYRNPKDFKQGRMIDGTFVPGVKGVRLVPYRLHELQGEGLLPKLFIVEGEKDVERLRAMGLLATCNPMGAEKWLEDYTNLLAGKFLEGYVIADNDDPGRKHARQVGYSLKRKQCMVKVIELPGLPPKGDLSDWLNAGHTKDELLALVEAAPYFVTTIEDTENALPPVEDEQEAVSITNADIDEDDDGKRVVVPYTMPELLADIELSAGGWPRRVGNSLFVPDGAGVRWIGSPAAMFGWLAQYTEKPVQWHRAVGCVTKEEFYETLRGSAQQYTAVESLPHFPSLAGHYYSCKSYSPGDGKTLQLLLDRFCPETPTDRDLILAAIVTAFWGGPAGQRPVFLVTSKHGRGVGKSSVGAVVADLAGLAVDVELREDMVKLKERLLSHEGRQGRVAMLDNVKSRNVSWAEFEALVTSPVISGRQMYVGEASRPNLLTWFLTLNGASLSTDVAGRCVIIEVGKPRYSGDWLADIRLFVDANRDRLISDVAGFFAAAPLDLQEFTRWGTWERDVLARLPNPVEAQKIIKERRAEADVECEEAELLLDYFAARLREHGFVGDRVKVHIPTRLAAEWVTAATNEKMSTGNASRHLGQLIDEGRLPRLTRNPTRANGRGFVWWGTEVACDTPTDYSL